MFHPLIPDNLGRHPPAVEQSSKSYRFGEVASKPPTQDRVQRRFALDPSSVRAVASR